MKFLDRAIAPSSPQLWRSLVCLAQGGVAAAGAADKKLDVYWVDVEGGAATLLVTPAGETVLCDTGYPGDRDADRVKKAVTELAGLSKIDHLIITHFHHDHYGGAEGHRQARAGGDPVRAGRGRGARQGADPRRDAGLQGGQGGQARAHQAGRHAAAQAGPGRGQADGAVPGHGREVHQRQGQQGQRRPVQGQPGQGSGRRRQPQQRRHPGQLRAVSILRGRRSHLEHRGRRWSAPRTGWAGRSTSSRSTTTAWTRATTRC